MIKFFACAAFVVLLGSLLAVMLTCALSQRLEWQVVMFRLEVSRAMTLAEAIGSRTWMVDIHTGIRKPLPFRYQSAVDGDISEDGSRTLLGVRAELRLFYRDPSLAERQLTDGPGYNGEPQANGDLRRIVFISNRDGPFDVYLLFLDEDDKPTMFQRVTVDKNAERDPRWLTRSQYHDYLHQFSRDEDNSIILNSR